MVYCNISRTKYDFQVSNSLRLYASLLWDNLCRSASIRSNNLYQLVSCSPFVLIKVNLELWYGHVMSRESDYNSFWIVYPAVDWLFELVKWKQPHTNLLEIFLNKNHNSQFHMVTCVKHIVSAYLPWFPYLSLLISQSLIDVLYFLFSLFSPLPIPSLLFFVVCCCLLHYKNWLLRFVDSPADNLHSFDAR